MDNNAVLLTDADRNKVCDYTADIIIAALDKGAMVLDDSQAASQFILNNIDLTKTNQDLLIFLEDLSTKWPIFQPYYLSKKNESDSKTKIGQIQQQLSELTN